MDKKFKLMVIQGPNINMLGTREVNVYGGMKMEDIHAQMKLFAEQNGKWLATRDGRDFYDVLNEALSAASGEAVEIAEL